jgi:hypothetical protein
MAMSVRPVAGLVTEVRDLAGRLPSFSDFIADNFACNRNGELCSRCQFLCISCAMRSELTAAAPARLLLWPNGQEIEREVDWDEGGRSIYLRDPGNVVELAPPTLWSRGWEF